jgi:hypothetical protein
MNAILKLPASQLKVLYNTLAFHKSKDKIDMVLEPLQSMIQLALLSVSPIGTKLTIQENILYLQVPNIIQPITRWYNADKKDDLYFLFQVIKRFTKWYSPENPNSPLTPELYELIINMSIDGLNNLVKTYSSSESTTVIQVINMYKNMLERKASHEVSDEKVNMDEVFENIIKIYDVNILNVLYNSLILIKKEDDIIALNNYTEGLNMMLSKIQRMIKDWVKSNLIV